MKRVAFMLIALTLAFTADASCCGECRVGAWRSRRIFSARIMWPHLP